MVARVLLSSLPWLQALAPALALTLMTQMTMMATLLSLSAIAKQDTTERSASLLQQQLAHQLQPQQARSPPQAQPRPRPRPQQKHATELLIPMIAATHNCAAIR